MEKRKKHKWKREEKKKRIAKNDNKNEQTI
jgi:hypothetical protein